MGTTPQEAVTHLLERLNHAIRNARSQVIPILKGVFENDQAAVDAGRLRAATMEAQISADALYTILSIAYGGFDPTETARLNTVDLVTLTPLEVIAQAYFPQTTYFSNPFFGYPTPNGILKDGTEKQPLVLKLMENGAPVEKQFARGYGVGTRTLLTYALPDKVYERFECHVGLHPVLGVEGSVGFRVYADGEAVFDSGILTGNDTARKVEVPLWHVRELSIDVEGRGSVAPGKNYAVIAAPVLFKAAVPPKLGLDKVP